MIALLLAAAAATTTPSTPAVSADADLHCMAAYLIATGNSHADAAMSNEDKAGVQSIVMYFFGKLDARRPGADLRGEIMQLVQSPGYATETLGADVTRCSAEAEARGKYLSTFGDKGESGAGKP